MSASTKENSETNPRKRRRSMPDPNAFAFTIADAQSLGLCGRTKCYELFKSGRLKYHKIGGQIFVDGDSLRSLLRGEP